MSSSYTVTYAFPHEREREREFEGDLTKARSFAQSVLEDGGTASITDSEGEEVDVWSDYRPLEE
jgi:hypothetical protein